MIFLAMLDLEVKQNEHMNILISFLQKQNTAVHLNINIAII